MPISHSKTVAQYLSDLHVPLLKFKFGKGRLPKQSRKKKNKSATLVAILEAYCACRYTKT